MDNNTGAVQFSRGVDPNTIGMLIERYEHIAEFPGVSKDTIRALEQVIEDLQAILDTRG